MINTNPYSLDLPTEANKRFIAAMKKNYGDDGRLGHYAVCFYANGQVIEAALAKTGGKSDNADEFVKAIRSVTLAQTPRGPLSFDSYVSQFWTMDPKAFLAQPVFSRDYPPMKS